MGDITRRNFIDGSRYQAHHLIRRPLKAECPSQGHRTRILMLDLENETPLTGNMERG
jgi:hypothetical protein